MSLRKVGHFYWLDIRIKGKRIRRSLKTHIREIALDRYPEKKKELEAEYGSDEVRFSDFCKQYLEWAYATKPITAIREEQRLNIILGLLGDEIRFFSDMSPYVIEGIKVRLRKRGLAKSTINQYLSLLKIVFNRAIDWEVFKERNPVRKVRFFQISSQKEALSVASLKKVMEEARLISESPRSATQKAFYGMFLLALNTGMRRGEILNLRWRDVREDEIVIRGKGEKRREIPLNQVAKDVLSGQPQRSEYVFDVPARGRSDIFKRITERIRKRTGIPFHFHLLRHTFTTMLLERGVDLMTIGSILGHSRITMSLLYSHTDREKKKKAVDLMDTFKDMDQDNS